MSLLSTFLFKHLVPALESELLNHTDEAKDFLLKQAKHLADTLHEWVASKIPDKSITDGE